MITPFNPYSALWVTTYCIVPTFTWVLYEQGEVYGINRRMTLVGVVVGCRDGLVGTGWANSCLRCTNVVRESYTHLVGASFLVVELVWAQK